MPHHRPRVEDRVGRRAVVTDGAGVPVVAVDGERSLRFGAEGGRRNSARFVCHSPSIRCFWHLTVLTGRADPPSVC